MNEEDVTKPSQSDVFAASNPFAEAPPLAHSFGVLPQNSLGIDAFNPAGPVPLSSPLPNAVVEATCSDVHRSLSIYLDGELTMPQQQAVRSHLDDCGPCQSAQAFQMQFRSTLATKALDPMPDDVRARITRALGFE